MAVINNFVDKEEVYYFTRKQPLEEKPKLPIRLAKPLHSLVMTVSSNTNQHLLHYKYTIMAHANR